MSSSSENEEEECVRFGILRGSTATYRRSVVNDDAKTTTTYANGFLDTLAISLFNAKLASVVVDGDDNEENNAVGYARLVRLANRVSRGRDVEAQRDVVTRALLGIIPYPIRVLFKKIIKPADWVDVMNAVVTREAFAWLVGPCEIVPREGDGVMASVKLRKCRYLEECGCTASCTNFCKVPTQRFFKEAFGVDARLDPNHEDGSCMMTFGVAPAVNDPAFEAPCYATCAKGKCESGAPCHRIGEPPKGL